MQAVQLINENLTWSNHITTLITKVSKNIGVIRKVSKILPSDVLYSLYNTLIKPYFEYCNIVWATNKTILFDKLFILQKKAIRIITSSRWNTHTASLFQEKCILKDIHGYDTRHCKDIHLTYFRTNLRGSCIQINGPKVWNAIPVLIKNVKTVHAFKRKFIGTIYKEYK